MNADSIEMLEKLRDLPNRCWIGRFLNNHNLLGEVAEIGVDQGNFASAVLADWKGRSYLAIDLWGPQDPTVYSEQFDWARSFQAAQDLAKRDPRVRLLKMLSTSAAAMVSDASLDWVWIDANHETPAVVSDMNAWWPKVKPGGVFSGHDFYYLGVRKAVMYWMPEHRVSFVTCDSSWFAIKDTI